MPLFAVTVLVGGMVTVLLPASPAAATVHTFAYVVNNNSHTVSVLDTAINTVTATITDTGTNYIAISPAGADAYVTDPSLGRVTRIDTATNTVVATISISGYPNYNDSVNAGDGNDTVDGGNGTDTVDGGNGTDTCVNTEVSLSC
jgi:YVTN family beta-propeller protein